MNSLSLFNFPNARRVAALLALLCIALVARTSLATTTVYSNRSIFVGTLGSIVIDDYENPGYQFHQTDDDMTSVLGETRYETTGHTDNNLVPGSGTMHYYCAGCNGSYLMDFTATSVSDANGVYGVGFEFFNAGSPLYSAFVTFGDDSTLDIPLDPAAFNSGNFPSFIGITSDKLIKTMHLGLANGGTTQSGSFGQDNLTIGSAIPEPATALLATVAALGFVTSMRRRVDPRPSLSGSRIEFSAA